METSDKIRVGIIGATGYAGEELLRLLLNHPQAVISGISSVSFEGESISKVYPALSGFCDMILSDEDTVIQNSDVVFASLPHGLSEPKAKKCLEQGKAFIDLGADFRLYDEKDYQQWYGLSYQEKALHEQAVYCIPELHRALVAGKKLIGNPGCYPTSIALGLAPAVKADFIRVDNLIIDSKSGVTGAGRGLSQTTHYPDCNEAFSPYKVAAHRHTPEIEQTISGLAGEQATITFVPHLLPVNRGIVSTIYAELKEKTAAEEIYQQYCSFYRQEQFVRVMPLGSFANLKNVTFSNMCDISLHMDIRTNRLIIVSTIDNMIKGAAGQAIQNMNLICGLPDNTGLHLVPPAF